VHAHVPDNPDVIGMPTFSNILRPLRASISAMSCGVETADDGAGDRHLCASVSWMSPVPGAGRRSVVEVAPVGILEELLERLRHHRATPHHRRVGVDRKPIDIACSSYASSGCVVLPWRVPAFREA
jgi:hypothetical protein